MPQLRVHSVRLLSSTRRPCVVARTTRTCRPGPDPSAWDISKTLWASDARQPKAVDRAPVHRTGPLAPLGVVPVIEDEATLKHFFRGKPGASTWSLANPRMKPIRLDRADFKIQGKAAGTARIMTVAAR